MKMYESFEELLRKRMVGSKWMLCYPRCNSRRKATVVCEEEAELWAIDRSRNP